MISISKYKINTEHSSKDLKGGYTGNNLFVLHVYLNEKGPPLTIHFLNIFKDHRIVTKSDPKMGYDEWLSLNTLWMKFYNSYGNYRPELSEYF